MQHFFYDCGSTFLFEPLLFYSKTRYMPLLRRRETFSSGFSKLETKLNGSSSHVHVHDIVVVRLIAWPHQPVEPLNKKKTQAVRPRDPLLGPIFFSKIPRVFGRFGATMLSCHWFLSDLKGKGVYHTATYVYVYTSHISRLIWWCMLFLVRQLRNSTPKISPKKWGEGLKWTHQLVNAMIQWCAGIKVRTDLKSLKKTVKCRRRAKVKSREQWDERMKERLDPFAVPVWLRWFATFPNRFYSFAFTFFWIWNFVSFIFF